MPILAGQLRQRVTVERPHRVKNLANELEERFEPIADVWAEIKPGAADEQIGSGQPAARVAHVVRIRWRKDVTAACRLVYMGRVLDVLAAVDPDNRREELRLECTEEVTGDAGEGAGGDA